MSRSLLSIFDKLKNNNPLAGQKKSVFSLIGTFMVIGLSIALFVLWLKQYNHSETYVQFQTYQPSSSDFTLNQDLKIAIVFKNKVTNQILNHKNVRSNLNTLIRYQQSAEIFRQVPFQQCQNNYFSNAVNPIFLQDCFLIQSKKMFNIKKEGGFKPYISLLFSLNCGQLFKCNNGGPSFRKLSDQITVFFQQNYYQLYLSSTVIINGQKQTQIHKFFSTNYQNEQYFTGNIQIQLGQNQYIYESDVLSSHSKSLVKTLGWKGFSRTLQLKKEIMPKSYLSNTTLTHTNVYHDQIYLFVDQIFFSQYVNQIFVYHKTLDLFLAVLAGSIFIVFIVFSTLCSCLNTFLAKKQIFNQLYLEIDQKYSDKIEKQTYNKKDLHISSISYWKYFWQLLGIEPSQEKKKMACVNKTMDIIKILKNLKVAQRNLQINERDIFFRQKELGYQHFSSQFKQSQRNQGFNKLLNIPEHDLQTIQRSKNFNNIYSQNLTLQIMRKQESNESENNRKRIIAELKQEQSYDQFYEQKKTVNSRFKQVKKTIFSTLKYLDLFGVKPSFHAQPQNYSCCGFVNVLVILALIILTLVGTFHIATNTKFIIMEGLDQPETPQFVLKTPDNFKFAVCFHTADPLFYLQGPYKVSQLVFYRYQNSQQKILGSQRMNASQMSYFGYYPQQLSQFATQNCFRIKNNEEIKINGKKQSLAYLGFKFVPYCGSETKCDLAILNKNFTTFINKYQIILLVSQIRYDPISQKLQTGVFQKIISSKNMITNSTAFQKIFFVDAIQQYDVKQPKYSNRMPTQKTLSFSQFLDKKQSKTIAITPTESPFYDIQIRYSGQRKSIYSKRSEALQIIGIIGGIILFWVALLSCFGKAYNKYKTRQTLINQLYRRQSKTSPLISFLRTYLPINCFFGNKKQFQQQNRHAQKLLNQLQLFKTTHTLANLSTALFQKHQQKMISKLYFKRTVDLKNQLKFIKTQENIENFQNQQDEPNLLLSPKKNSKITNSVISQHQNSVRGLLQKQKQMHGLINSLSSNMNFLDFNQSNLMLNNQNFNNQFPKEVLNMQETTFTDYIYKVDFLRTGTSLTINGKTQVKSIFGGTCTILFIILAILLIIYFLIIPKNHQNFDINKVQYIDKLDFRPKTSQMSYTQGIQFRTGSNFKLAVSFYLKADDSIRDVSSEITNIGISIYQVSQYKNGAIYTTQETQTALQICHSNYFNGWLGYTQSQERFSSLSDAYCVPNNVSFNLKGSSGEIQIDYIKLSIFDNSPNSTAKAQLSAFLQKYLVKYHISSPIKQSFYNSNLYEIISFSLSEEPQSFPVQRNITFSKLIFQNIAQKKGESAFSFKFYSQYERSPSVDIYAEHRNDLFFYYSDVVQHTIVGSYSNIQLFGLFGGCFFLLVLIFSCLISSFNNYKMSYIVGKKLYAFQYSSGQRIPEQKCKYKVNKIKNFSQFQLFRCWILLPIAFFINNFYFNKTLRQISVIQQIVKYQLSIYKLYKKILAIKDALTTQIRLEDYPQTNLTNLYVKQIYSNKTEQHQDQLIKNEAKKHELSAYEQCLMQKCMASGGNQIDHICEDKQFVKSMKSIEKIQLTEGPNLPSVQQPIYTQQPIHLQQHIQPHSEDKANFIQLKVFKHEGDVFDFDIEQKDKQ